MILTMNETPQDLEWWEIKLSEHMDLKYWYTLRKKSGRTDMDYDSMIAKKEAQIKDIENKITQIENLKQDAS